jgi:hypothetical protein
MRVRCRGSRACKFKSGGGSEELPAARANIFVCSFTGVPVEFLKPWGALLHIVVVVVVCIIGCRVAQIWYALLVSGRTILAASLTYSFLFGFTSAFSETLIVVGAARKKCPRRF